MLNPALPLGPFCFGASRNWSTLKRNFVAGLICLLTFGVYVGSAIYTSSIPGLMEEFECSQVVATLGLTLFVVGYGIGPSECTGCGP